MGWKKEEALKEQSAFSPENHQQEVQLQYPHGLIVTVCSGLIPWFSEQDCVVSQIKFSALANGITIISTLLSILELLRHGTHWNTIL